MGVGTSKACDEEDLARAKCPIDPQFFVENSKLYVEIMPNQCPLVYSSEYNISAYGFEKLHPLDSKKYGKVYDQLIRSGRLNARSVVRPLEASTEDLLVVHSERYLESIKSTTDLTAILEVPVVLCLPYCLVECCVLRPMRFQTGGTILAAKLALEKGWAINIGGGFHHASADNGGGFCVYADITLAIKFLFLGERISRAMIVDLDAHQGNGHERDFMNEYSPGYGLVRLPSESLDTPCGPVNKRRVYIFDMFNAQIYPHDVLAKVAITKAVPLNVGTGDEEYMRKLTKELDASLSEFQAHLLVYNAGTDLLRGDPLGLMQITPEGVIQRDETVFKLARQHQVPIMMVTSGGYTARSARVIGDSILNLHDKGYIQLC